MFHPAELESRQNDQVVFGEGVWYLCIFLLPFECIEHFGCDIGALCYFLRVGLTMVDRNVPSVARIRFPCQLTGNKREKIGAERFRFPERNPLAPGDGSNDRVKSDFMSGWSKQGKSVRARSGTSNV